MIQDVHAKIHALLQVHTPKALPSAVVPAADASYNKAGLLPYIKSDPWRFLVMKPVAKHTHLAPPALQLCKGTRMQHWPGKGWRDVRDGMKPQHPLEPLVVTALREGIEELGVELSGIRALQDLGPYAFSSSVSSDAKFMWLYAAEMHSESALLPDTHVAATTAQRAWLDLKSFEAQGRADHVPILRDIASRLAAS